MTANKQQDKLVLDREAALGFVGYDRDFLRDLVETFADYYPAQLERIEAAIDAEDASELREVAHQLKGAVSNFFAQPAGATAYELECSGRDGKLDVAASLHQELSGRLNELQSALNGLVSEME